jgi:dehydrogenase/reductase SDR family member 1
MAGEQVGRLSDRVAIVTGGSRGVGKGVALGLGEAGAKVYVTGRTAEPLPYLAGTIHETAAEVTRLGGKGIALVCDHQDDLQVEGVFQGVLDAEGRIDILVNAAWGGYERMFDPEKGEFTWPLPFWKQPLWRWDAMFDGGVRAAYVASTLVAGSMVAHGSGLIVNISFWAAKKYIGNVAYGASKAATDKMTRDMAEELKPHGVSVVSLYPGLVRTERVMEAAAYLDLSNSESPVFTGRAVSALANDAMIMKKSGQELVAAQLAIEYGFTDIDGKQPVPLSIETV